MLAGESSDRLPGDADALSGKTGAVVDRVQVADDAASGRTELVDEAMRGLTAAQRLLIAQLELPSPAGLELVISRLSSGVEGLTIPVSGRQSRTRILIDPTLRAGVSAVRRAAEHQYAHAVAQAAGLDAAWSEAFATWTAMSIERSPDDRSVTLMSNKLAASGDGLVSQDTNLAAGNAAWFEFLNDAYGPTAVKLSIEELGRGGSDQAALDRAVRRATGEPLDAALRDFQVWSLLVGPRDDGRHFTFASRLAAPTFAASEDALPALSIQADPLVGPMGQAAILIRPEDRSGGVSVRFEGDASARWAADVLLVQDDGGMRRVALPLDGDGAGEATLPVQDVREVMLLVRNLDPEGHPARPYSWAAHFEPGFPAEFGSVRADETPGGGAVVSWETSTERHILGFNVLRTRGDAGEPTRVNPVWIPAVAESGGPAAYSFYDATAEPGIPYRYRVEAVTLEGLPSRSEAFAVSPAP